MPPYLIIVMGVSGCGKSTVASALAKKFSCRFIEADDFHSSTAKAHMANGKPLNDDMRAPWIKALQRTLKQSAAKNVSCVMSYSGLRSTHRHAMRNNFNNRLFLHLNVSKHIVFERLNSRKNHFMPATLLDSQFAALQATDSETDVININADAAIEHVINESVTLVSKHLNT